MINKKLLNPIQNKGATKTGSGDVTLDTDQTITGEKNFEKGIFFEKIAGKQDTKIENSSGSLLFYNRGRLALKLNSREVSFNNQRLLYIGNPTDAEDAVNKRYVDDNLVLKADKTEITALDTKLTLNTNDISDNTAGILLKADKTELVNKQDKLTAGTGIDITGDTISSTTVVSPDTALTSKTNTFDFRQVIKSGGSGLLDLQNSTGSVLNTTYDLASTSVKLTSPNTTSMTFTAKDFNFSDKEIKNVGTPITNKSAANKEYVDKADTLFKRATTSIASTTTAGDSTQTITSIFDAATWDLIKASNQYYLLAYTSGRASRTGFPIVIKMEYAMTSDDYNVHTGAGDFTFFNYTDFATTYAIKVMVALSRENGSFRFAASFNGTLNANFNINRIEIWKKGTV